MYTCLFGLFLQFYKKNTSDAVVGKFYLNSEDAWFLHRKLLPGPSGGWQGSCVLTRPTSELALKLRVFYPTNTQVLLSVFLHIRMSGTYMVTSGMCFHARVAGIQLSDSDLEHVINNNTVILIQR